MNAGRKQRVFLNLCLCFLFCFLILAPVQASNPETIPVTIKGKFDYQKSYDVLKRTNAIRKSKGLPALVMDKKLLDAAMQRAAEISVVFSHHRPDKSMCFSAAPGRMIGENIALGQKSAAEVITAWKNSPGHYKNIVNSHYGSIGVGCFNYNGTLYWAQAFGRNTYTRVSRPSNRTVKVPIALDRGFAEKYIYSTSARGKRLYTGETTEIKLYFYSTKHDYETFKPVQLLWNNFRITSKKSGLLSVGSSGKVRALRPGKEILDIVDKGKTGFRDSLTLQISNNKKRTVKLYANGGTFGRSSAEKIRKLTVTYKKPYGKLPVPVRKGYVFKGWYTKESGGSRITASKRVTISKGKTQKLYARWSKR